MKLVIIILTTMLLSISAIASQNERQKSTPTVKDPIAEKAGRLTNNIQSNQLNEPTIYKLLYENSASANDRIISTMHWTIGLVSTFILAIFGSQILFNYRINKEEIEAIRSDLDEKFVSLKSDLMNDINSTMRENEKTIRGELILTVTEGLETISEKQKDLEKFLDAKMESSNREAQILKDDIRLELNNIKVDLGRMSGYVWDLKGVKANALGNCIDTAIMQIDLGRDPYYTLKDVVKMLKESDSINKVYADNLENLISKIPDSHSNFKQEIESSYKEKRVYIFVDDPDRPGYSKAEYI
ncbi:hypothetical protein [Marinobacter salarius]|uniref:hypothetical protein n=1 Tax=Marinobacter salarius TaxID=1420917 RepID=UPI003BAC7BC6